MKHHMTKTGFTMVELLLVMAIFSIIMTGVYKVFQSQNDAYVTQDEVAAMQQNARPCMFMIAKDARMANTLMGGENGFVESVKIWDNYNGLGADVIDIVYANFAVQTPVEIADNCNTNTGSNCYMPIPSAVTNVGDHSMPIGKNDTCPDGSSPPDDGCCSTDKNGYYQECFKKGDVVIISDGKNSSDIMEITQVISSGGSNMKLGHNPGASSGLNLPGNPDWPEDGFKNDAKIFKVKFVSYRIMETIPGHPSLSYCPNAFPNETPDERTYEPVAENIEDFQVALIFANGDETFANPDDDTIQHGEIYGTGNDASPYNPGVDGDGYGDPRAIRITIVARSDREIPHITGSKVKVENHDPGGTTDHFMRKVHTMEVNLRNYGLHDE